MARNSITCQIHRAPHYFHQVTGTSNLGCVTDNAPLVSCKAKYLHANILVHPTHTKLLVVTVYVVVILLQCHQFLFLFLLLGLQKKKITQAQCASKLASKIWEKLTKSTQYKWSSLGFSTV